MQEETNLYKGTWRSTCIPIVTCWRVFFLPRDKWRDRVYVSRSSITSTKHHEFFVAAGAGPGPLLVSTFQNNAPILSLTALPIEQYTPILEEGTEFSLVS